MKFKNLKILDESNKILRNVSKPVTFPLSNQDKELIFDALNYLKISQIENLREKYDLRAGMGLAFIQLGIQKRIFVICNEIETEENEEQKFENYVVINPTILSKSEEMIYVEDGEGCLSVNREVEGIIPRHARMTVEAYNENGEKYTIRVREELSVAFQHEIDHLNGILFPDLIDKNNPYKNEENMRAL